MRLPEAKAHIGGRFHPFRSGETFPSINSANGAILCEVELSLEPEVDAAVEAARAGLAVWSAMTSAERVRLLRARNDELAALEVLDTGKPIQEALAVDVHSGI